MSNDGRLMGWEREPLDPTFRPPAFYMSMTPAFASSEYGFPTPLPKAEVTAYDGSVWVFNVIGSGNWEMMNYPPTGDPYGPVKDWERQRRGVSIWRVHSYPSGDVLHTAQTYEAADKWCRENNPQTYITRAWPDWNPA